MLPPKRMTRTSLTGLGLVISAKDDGRNSDETSTQSETPVTRQPRKPVSSPSRAGEVQKKSRRKLTATQKQLLEEHAAHDINPSLEERRVLASQTGLDLKSVSVWFQNKRRPTTVNRVPIATIYTPKTIDTSKLGEESDTERVVLGNVVNNFSPPIPQTPRHIDFRYSLKPEGSNVSFDLPAKLWDYLSSSSPASKSDVTETSVELMSPTPNGSKRPRSLDWACRNDARGKIMKRNIETFLDEASTMSPLRSPVRKRQRTDAKPSNPSPRHRQQIRPTIVRRLSIATTCCEYVDKDVFDVAVALIEMKSNYGLHGQRARKSI